MLLRLEVHAIVEPGPERIVQPALNPRRHQPVAGVEIDRRHGRLAEQAALGGEQSGHVILSSHATTGDGIVTALAVLGAIHAAHAGPPWLAITAGIIAFCEAIVVLVLRAHYTLDVVAGAFAAFVAYDIAMAISPSLDGWLR